MAFRQTLALLSQKSKSSAQWIARQSRDPYVKRRAADPAGYRARSAFKLVEINEQNEGFLDHDNVKAVVDLGAAPGGWSQVVAGKFGWGTANEQLYGSKKGTSEHGIQPLSSCQDPVGGDVRANLQVGDKKSKRRNGRFRRPIEDELEHYDPLNIEDLDGTSGLVGHHGRGTIVAVDLLPIAPVLGVTIIQGDFLLDSTTQLIKEALTTKDNPCGMADVILSDMAGNVSGNRAHDIESSLEICKAVLEFAKWNLRSSESIGRRKGGVLLMKYFSNPLLHEFREEKLMPHFNYVYNIKPESSRSSSRECYFLCQGWNPDPDYF